MNYLLVYDDGCGPCTRFRNAVELLDTRGRLDYAGIDEADREGRLDSISPSRRHRSFHLVSPGGRVWSGASALQPLAALLPGGKALSEAMKVPPVFSVAAFVYSAFSRLHDTGSCVYARGTAEGPARRAPTIDLDINVDSSSGAFADSF